VNEVAAVTYKTSPMTAKIAMHHQPRTGLEGKFSLEYCVATALLRGKVSLEDFTDERVTEAKAQDLLSKVSYLHPKEYSTSGGNLAQEVVIELKNGTEYSHRVTFPKGDPKNPMTNKELLAKFRDCATLSLTQLETEQVLDLITDLEYLDDISRLMETLT